VTPEFSIVIPARHASSRFPGKPLALIAGKPMLQWVHERAKATAARDVIVGTDDARIAAAASAFGARVVMTSPDHATGTDRIAEVVATLGWPDDTIVVNLQGDEPLMPAALLLQVAATLVAHPHAAIATLAAPITNLEDFLDTNVVKVVLDETGRALYFSRAPIPWTRDAAPGGLATQTVFAGARRHLGLYAYRVGALRRLAAWPPEPLEDREKLEQLRALAHGLEIRVVDAAERPGPDVNSPADLPRVAALLGRSV
jgi:3-deoxy-manno-octulosonate cytidylyltransferase (CMP-KDO synthetase)